MQAHQLNPVIYSFIYTTTHKQAHLKVLQLQQPPANMAFFIPIIRRDSIASHVLPYQVTIALTGGLLLLTLCTLLYTCYHLRFNRRRATLIVKATRHLENTLKERDGQVADLEAQLYGPKNPLNGHKSSLGNLFTIGDDEEDDYENVACDIVDGHSTQYGLPVSGPLEPRVARVVSPRIVTVVKPKSRRDSITAVVDGPTAPRGSSSALAAVKEA